jgi:hypothetical protein
MSTFSARLHLPGRAKLPLGVEIDIQHERMTVISGDRKVAVLPLEDLDVSSRSDGFHLKIDGEDVVLIVGDSSRFAAALGIKEYRRLNVVKPKRSTPESTANHDQLTDLERRVIEVRETLRSDAVTPAQACSQWLSLLKELNRQHGEGSMVTGMFYRLNTQVLDLIPEPAPVAGSLISEPA